MNCREARARLTRYADGELPAAESGELREHLKDCLRCRGGLSEIASVRRFFEDPAGASVRAPAGFADRVAAAALAGPFTSEPPEAIVRFTRWIAAAAAAVTLAAGGALLVRGGAFESTPSILQAQETDPTYRRIRERFSRPVAPAVVPTADGRPAEPPAEAERPEPAPR